MSDSDISCIDKQWKQRFISKNKVEYQKSEMSKGDGGDRASGISC